LGRFVALLRGVNVGRGQRVPMARWREILLGLGHTGVRTLLNSGNAIFTSRRRDTAGIAGAIRAALLAELAVDVPVIVAARSAFEAVVAQNPLAEVADDPARLLVALAASPADLPSLAPLKDLARPPERFEIGEQAAYLWCPQGVLASAAASALLGKAGQAVTTRNWATVLKIGQALRETRAGA
jgi:uncharacterized protein (DUF1697 family)